MEIALATHTAPADWWSEDEATLATALDILVEMAEATERATRTRGHR